MQSQALRLKKEISEGQARAAGFEGQIQELEGHIQVGVCIQIHLQIYTQIQELEGHLQVHLLPVSAAEW